MTQGSRRWSIVPACVVIVALSYGAAGAADKTKVDQATRRVEQGAKQIGQGDVGPGFKEMFTGVGYTIVEGAKFSGNTIGEFFKRTFGG
ncbi:MAG TPA: hypothetical protein VN646_07550 [Candidatus Acidoferrum sp.]|jgi:hypothetical protein|nr:hypothetical protein [Candidatus Acidoferrum sp.]